MKLKIPTIRSMRWPFSAVDSDVIDGDDADDTDNVIECGSSKEIRHIDISMICWFYKKKKRRKKKI